jgi:hypothetical protein
VSITHLVITRLNLTVDFDAARDTLDVGWLRTRLEPFARFCHPSMRIQEAPHRWLVLCDQETPAVILEELAGFAGVTPVLLPRPHGLETLGAAVAAAVAGDGATHLLTTRLDSDDALAAGHLARVRAAADPRDDPCFLNFPYGHVWHGERAYPAFNPASQFLSYLEPLGASPPLTAYRVAHTGAATVAPVRQLWAPPMWMQVVAGHNSDTTFGDVRSLRRRPPRGFRGQPAFADVRTPLGAGDTIRAVPEHVRTHCRRVRLLATS